MMKLWIQLKTVRLGVWFLCVFIIYMGICFIHFLNTPMSENEMASREAQRYANLYNKPQPNEKMPIYDYSAWGLVKRDGRYFLIPKEYAGASGFSFYWPLSLQKEYSTAIYHNPIDGQRRGKATIEVFMDSSRESWNVKYRDLMNAESCHAQRNSELRWNKLVIWTRFDDSHRDEWPQICLEIVRILNQVKEVKP